MNCIILLASPAAGKGTVSSYIMDKYNFDHISTGDLLRKEISDKTELGLKIENGMDRGFLVDDDVITDLLDKRLSSINDSFILEGYPRNLNQAKLLEPLFDKYNINLSKVIYIDIDKEVAIERIENRLTCDKCKTVYNKMFLDDNKICKKCGGNLVSRDDDNRESFINRYNIYEKETKPLVNYYESKIIKIYNNYTVEKLYEEVDKVFKGDELYDNN